MAGDRPRVLCVDDEPWNLELLEAILVPEGFDVVPARNGSEALETLRRQPIEIVLLDVVMPVLGGFEACRIIKADEAFRNIPVIMITSLTDKRDRIRGIEAGAEEFLSKPFDRDEVVARIRMLLRIKELNDRLSFAYSNITSLTTYGEEILGRLQPVRFELLSSVDAIVDQVLRKPAEGAGKPAAMFVGLADPGLGWKWFRYDRVHGKLSRHALPVHLHAGPVFPMQGKEKTFFWNEGDPRNAFFTAIFDRLGEIRIPVRNALCRLSGNLSIVAVNYGRAITSYDASVLDSLLIHSLFFKSLSEQITETEGAFLYMVQALARSSEANDEDTGYHISRIGEYSALLADRLAMSEEFVRTIRFQASLHDVGKVHTHPDILRKQGPLAPWEWEEMRRHPIVGANIVGVHPRLQMARTIALTHHERWDGSGYPYGLRGVEIPIEGRITSVADNYDALRSSRPYKQALDHATAFRILTEGNERTNPDHYDPEVLAAFRDIAPLIEETYERMKNP